MTLPIFGWMRHFIGHVLIRDSSAASDSSAEYVGLGFGCRSRTSPSQTAPHENIQNLPMESGQAQRKAAHARVPSRHERLRPDGVGRPAEDQK